MTTTAVATEARPVTAPPHRWSRGWEALFEERAGLRPMALLRIALGPIVILHLAPFLAEVARGGWYGDHFFQPYVSWYPQAPRPLYAALVWGAAVTAVLLTLGLWTRVVATLTFTAVSYNLFLSRTHFHNNRAFLVILLGGVALAPTGRVLSVDSWRRRRAGRPLPDAGPRWPQWLLRFEASAVYLASGVSKLLDPDWRSGLVTWDRVVRVRPRLDASVLPEPVVDLLSRRTFHAGAAKAIILTELFIALGLWPRRTRLAAVWVAVAFHLAIEVAASVQVFTVAAMAALVVWADPVTPRRLVTVRGGSRAARTLAWSVRRLDWLGRFSLDHDPHAPAEPAAVTVTEADGTSVHGAAAARVVLTRLPATFWPVAPASLPGLRAVWDRAVAPLVGPAATGPRTPAGAASRSAARRV